MAWTCRQWASQWSQVSPGGGRFPSRDPPAPVSSRQRRSALRSKVRTGRREGEERRGELPPGTTWEVSCAGWGSTGLHWAPLGSTGTDWNPGFTGAWELAGIQVYRWEQGKLYSFHSQHRTQLKLSVQSGPGPGSAWRSYLCYVVTIVVSEE